MSSPDDVRPEAYDLWPSVVASSRPVRPGVHLLVVVDELDMATAPQLRQAAANALAARPRVLAIDLGGVSFVASAGLGALLRIHQRAAAEGCRMVLVSVPDPVRRVIGLIGLAGLFVEHETLEAALVALGEPAEGDGDG